MKTKLSALAVAASFALFGPLAWAGNEVGKISTSEFRERRAQIEAELAPGKTYAYLNSRQKGEVRELLGRMDAVLGKHETSESLSKQQQTRLFNDQERLNVLLGMGAESDRVTCRREHVVGSNRPVRVCRTAAERAAAAAQARDELDRLQRSQMGMPSSR